MKEVRDNFLSCLIFKFVPYALINKNLCIEVNHLVNFLGAYYSMSCYSLQLSSLFYLDHAVFLNDKMNKI
jgi:hypothetical protein